MNKEPSQEVLYVRLLPQDKEQLERMATQLGLSLSGFIRMQIKKILAENPIDKMEKKPS